jgi:hypothetical protein
MKQSKCIGPYKRKRIKIKDFLQGGTFFPKKVPPCTPPQKNLKYYQRVIFAN